MNPAFEQTVRALYDREIELEFHDEGCCNSIIIVDKKDVYRFPKGKWAFSSMEKDVKLMQALEEAKFFDVPKFYSYNGVYAHFAYMPGQDLSTELVAGMDEKERKAAAEQLGDLLYRLHQNTQIDFKKAGTTSGKDRYEELLQTATQYYPRLTSVGINYIKRLIRQLQEEDLGWDYKPAFVHGDLAPFHIKYDTENKKLNGIIDFGEAGIGDPATDLCMVLYYLGKEFALEMAAGYPGLEKQYPRARFLAETLEIYWFIAACENRGPIFFGPHLGAYNGF